MPYGIAIGGRPIGGSGSVWHVAYSLQEWAHRVTDADVDVILSDRAHCRALCVWVLLETRGANAQYGIASKLS